ncbi:F-box protein SKIP23-like [Cicer arietinum]|uniref:F-box protein SKIP23-like n=1 Tax=Cicer arietinum TaxID=3827 RepID=A0A1S2Y5U6_CICAR|nr:F-box protein SKIP23-like [Cicer arietinum]
MADWAELPREILQLISEFLQSELYIIRFRSVCSTWRSSISSNLHLYRPLQLPFPGDSMKVYSYANTKFKTNYDLSYPLSKPPPIPNHPQTLQHPWLIKIGPNSRDQTHLWHPFSREAYFPLHAPNVIDFNQLNVTHLGHEFVIGKIISRSPNQNYVNRDNLVLYHDTCHNGNVVLAINYCGKLAVFRCGEERWKIITETGVAFTDVCIFKGRTIAVDTTGRTVAVGPDFSLDLVAEAVFGSDFKYFVESDGELLLIDKYLSFDWEDRYSEYIDNFVFDGRNHFSFKVEMEKAVRFDVFRLHEKDKKWVEVTDLGDRVLFLGDGCSFSASASDLGVNGNCVVYWDDIHLEHSSTEIEMSIFHLDKRQISPLSDFPSYSKLFWPPPEWVRMVHN